MREIGAGSARGNGELRRADSVAILRGGEKNTWLQIALTEGKNRQIRRMLEALGIETQRLVRVAIGPLELGTLAKGSWRELTNHEKCALDLVMYARKTQAASRTIR